MCFEPGALIIQSTPLPSELKMGDNWLDEGAKEGEVKRGRKRYYCKRKKGQEMTKGIIWKEWLNSNFFYKLSVSKEGQLLTICSGPFTSNNLHHIVINWHRIDLGEGHT